MACNENTIKNMANEVTRNCQANNIPVDTDFVIYLIELLLLNPKYGKLFTKTINRNNLQYFVEECVEMLKRGDTSLHTLKMQFIIQSNYDKIQNLIDKHMDSIANCLRPLVNEILDSDPDPHEDNLTECKKLFRKISIYIILASGLGNPGLILTLKEGMAALESVFSLEDLKLFISLPRIEKVGQLDELVGVVSGVRLFNRDCKKGGESIPDLPFNLVDAGKACLTSLSNSLISVMQRVNTLTTAIDDAIVIQEETGNVVVQPSDDTDVEEFKRMFALLAFNRQYEVFTRKLLADVERAVAGGAGAVERCRAVLEELHLAVKYKAAVPTATVFPLFSKLWRVWRSMQHVMYIISVVARLVSALAATHEQVREVRPSMLNGRLVRSDQDRMNTKVPMEDRLSLNFLKGYVAYNESYLNLKDKQLSAQFLGFCAMCLTVGALVPSNMKLGFIQCEGKRYSFCCTKMAAKFAKDPKRYINEVLDYARNNPELINLLNIVEEVFKVKDIDELVIKYYAKIKVSDKDIQTVAHPIDEYIEKNYSWDLWEWKRRACQWATIVNCRTHSTQTDYSHLRSEIHCQTYEMRDKCYQTKKDQGVNTLDNSVFIWGLRGQIGYGQHYMKLGELHAPDKKKAQVVQICSWPCIEAKDIASPIGSGSEVTGENYVSSASDLDPSDQRSYIDSPLGETASTETDEPAI